MSKEKHIYMVITRAQLKREGNKTRVFKETNETKTYELVSVIGISAVLRAFLSNSKHQTSPTTHSGGGRRTITLKKLVTTVAPDGRVSGDGAEEGF